jgi:hypothetical protein
MARQMKGDQTAVWRDKLHARRLKRLRLAIPTNELQ